MLINRKFKQIKNANNSRNQLIQSKSVENALSSMTLPFDANNKNEDTDKIFIQVIENTCTAQLQYSDYTYELPTFEEFKSKKIRKAPKHRDFRNLHRNKKLLKLMHKQFESDSKTSGINHVNKVTLHEEINNMNNNINSANNNNGVMGNRQKPFFMAEVKGINENLQNPRLAYPFGQPSSMYANFFAHNAHNKMQQLQLYQQQQQQQQQQQPFFELFAVLSTG